MGVIFVLSTQSSLPNLTPGLPGLEEVGGHLAAYGLLAALVWWALRGMGTRYPATGALLLAVLYGASDELHQSFVPGRTMTINDLLVDLIGASLTMVVLSWFHARRLGMQIIPDHEAS
jgi:VanZ family protein